jgi:hypothetical protein
MGLDMYLYAEKYVSGYDYETTNGKMTRVDNPMYNEIIKSAGLDSLPSADYGSTTVTKCVAYWRKSNAIHGWIVRNLAKGVDECQRISMWREDIVSLRDACVRALDNRSNALPNEVPKSIELKEDDSSPNEVMNKMMSVFAEEAKKKDTNVTVADPLELEPMGGFFFGSTDKDEYFYSDVERTVEVLNAILASTTEDDYGFYYQASW